MLKKTFVTSFLLLTGLIFALPVSANEVYLSGFEVDNDGLGFNYQNQTPLQTYTIRYCDGSQDQEVSVDPQDSTNLSVDVIKEIEVVYAFNGDNVVARHACPPLPEDQCSNLDGIQATVPSGYEQVKCECFPVEDPDDGDDTGGDNPTPDQPQTPSEPTPEVKGAVVPTLPQTGSSLAALGLTLVYLGGTFKFFGKRFEEILKN